MFSPLKVSFDYSMNIGTYDLVICQSQEDSKPHQNAVGKYLNKPKMISIFCKDPKGKNYKKFVP